VAKRPAKKPQKQLDLPTPAPPPTTKVLPIQLQLGDPLADERSEWRVVGGPYSTVGGKTVHVRVESVKQPGARNTRTWGAHQRVSVTRE